LISHKILLVTKVHLLQTGGVLNPIRLNKENEAAIEKLVEESDWNGLTPPLAVNDAVKNGISYTRSRFVKGRKTSSAGNKHRLKK